MRILAAMRFVGEAGPELYTPTVVTKTMITPIVEAGVESTLVAPHSHSYDAGSRLIRYPGSDIPSTSGLSFLPTSIRTATDPPQTLLAHPSSSG